jgi:hypothetical protein
MRERSDELATIITLVIGKRIEESKRDVELRFKELKWQSELQTILKFFIFRISDSLNNWNLHAIVSVIKFKKMRNNEMDNKTQNWMKWK